MKIKRSHDFPNAVIQAGADGTYREFPKWCPMISVRRSRHYVAQALIQLRNYQRTLTHRHT
jgi:hypothetical protein